MKRLSVVTLVLGVLSAVFLASGATAEEVVLKLSHNFRYPVVQGVGSTTE